MTDSSGWTMKTEPHAEVAFSTEAADLAEVLACASPCELGERIKALRMQRGMVQKQVIDPVGSITYLSRVENGQTLPDLKRLTVIAARLGTSAHELLLGVTRDQFARLQMDLEYASLDVRTGAVEKARAVAERGLRLVPVGTSIWRRALLVDAAATEQGGYYAQAAEKLEEWLQHSPMQRESSLQVLLALCRCYRLAGDITRAIEVGSRATRYVDALGLNGTSEDIQLSLTIAMAYGESGSVDYALGICERTRSAAEKLCSPSDIGRSYWNASEFENERGNVERALELSRKAEIHFDIRDSERHAVLLQTQIGLLLLRQDPPQPAAALERLTKAEQAFATCDVTPAEAAENRLGQARAMLLLGEPDHARRLATESLEMTAGKAPLVVTAAHIVLTRVALACKDVAEAEEHLEAAETQLKARVGKTRSAGQIWFEIGGLWRSIKREAAADAAITQAGVIAGYQFGPPVIVLD